jgi:PilZ domain
MSSDSRIAARYVFESRILIRFCRGSQKFAVQGWARDLSESGLGAFVGENLVIGELVTLQIPLAISGKEVIAAKVTRQVGTQYGFQFTALSAEQRLGIQSALKAETAVPYGT